MHYQKSVSRFYIVIKTLSTYICIRSFFSLLLIVVLYGCNQSSLQQSIDSQQRDIKHSIRDQYRHPKETLEFFEVSPNLTVIEIWPAPGYYTEILATFLKDQGQYIAAGFGLTAKRTPKWRKKVQTTYNHWAKQNESWLGNFNIVELSIPERTEIAPVGLADRVLTFRNVHNWVKGDYEQEMFDAFFSALKPGGLLGVVEHRAEPSTSIEEMKLSGYVTEDYVIKLAEKSGLTFIGKSEINANSKDTKDHPQGVWTLPPTLRLNDVNRDLYLAIGESDRMTLKFSKPLYRPN